MDVHLDLDYPCVYIRLQNLDGHTVRENGAEGKGFQLKYLSHVIMLSGLSLHCIL